MSNWSIPWTALHLLLIWLLLSHWSWTRGAVWADPDPGSSPNIRTIHRLVGGHMNHLTPTDNLPSDGVLITSSAGNGREARQQQQQLQTSKDDNRPSSNSGGEEKKTLSQQVADGKYGLIQKEIFSTPSKKPGVISYDINPDVPADNINSLGGVTKNDIWLAENHLLVLRGGSFPAYDPQSENLPPVWPPLDDYNAPNRQVKLPAHPKVPPPFPVQLEDEGPLQILGTNFTTTLNGSFKAPPYTIPALEGGFYPGYPPPYPNPNPANASAGDTPFPIPPFPPPGDYGGPPPFPPLGFPINGTLPPFLASLPPGAAILPPPGNNTGDYYDDDDPSIYYPPPYSFYYPVDNTTRVPPGPLVPGIVLPPPPNFFGPLEPKQKPKKKRPQITATTTTTKRPYVTYYVYKTSSEPNKQIYPTTTPIPPTIITKIPTEPTTVRSHEPKIVYIQPVNKTIFVPLTTAKPPAVFVPERNKKRPSVVTILKPVKTTTQRPIYYYENNDVLNNVKPYSEYAPPPPHINEQNVISTTQVPLKTYFTTNEIDSNSVTQNPENNYYQASLKVPKSTTKAPTRYFFYEEDAITNSITTPKPQRQNQQPYYNIPNEYFVPAKESNKGQQYHRAQPQQHHQQNPQYYYVTNRPHRPASPPNRYQYLQATKRPSDSFSIHVARLKQQIHEYYPQRPSQFQQLQPPPPQIKQQYIQEQQQPTRYQQVPSPKPVYQFSFEAANYKQHQNQFRQPLIQQQHDLEDDKFRPMPKYSVQIQQAVEINPTEAPLYQHTPQPVYFHPKQTSERAVPSKYYSSTSRPDYDYEDVNQQEIHNQQQANKYVITPRPITQYAYEATQSPVYQPYYTKTDESYFDDITKKYFTIFGKKIPNATTPLPPVIQETSTRRSYPQQNPVHYVRNKPVSLASDTYVNYTGRRPQVNQQSEYVREPEQYRQYIQEDRPQNTDLVKAINVPLKLQPSNTADGKPGAFISYELPGDDGAHFYFLTPQLAQSRKQGAGFFYQKQINNRNNNNNGHVVRREVQVEDSR